MKFILISASKLKVILEKQDLEDLDISYEAIDYGDPATKQVLVALLEEGKGETGYNPKRAKLYIEVFPTEDEGMVVYFTTLQAGQVPQLKGGKSPVPVIFAFDDVDNLIEAGAKVFRRYSHRIYKSSLYRLGKQYRLIMYPLDYADRLSVYFLAEFAPLLGEGEILAAYAAEHGTCIIEDEALDTLARYFG